jgi:uncharacterized radical SAM superfamily Fe-S cluster-containing enzyme
MSWWAEGLDNERHLTTKIEEARHELARGTDRAAVLRSVTMSFAGADSRHVLAATRAHLSSSRSRFSIPSLLLAEAVTPSPDVEIVLVSELALFSLADEIPGVHSVVCSTLDCVDGRLTGYVSLVVDAADRRRAMAAFQGRRNAAAAGCTYLHRGDTEDAAVHGLAGRRSPCANDWADRNRPGHLRRDVLILG